MDNFLQKTPEQIAAEQRFKDELERRSEDECGVYNPIKATSDGFIIGDETYSTINNDNLSPNGTYICYWNSYGNEVIPQKASVFKRYIAEKALGELIDLILTARARKYVEMLNQKRYEQGQPKYTPREQQQIEESVDYKITEKKLRIPWVRIIWKGIIKENIRDIVLPSKLLKPQDTRPIDEQLIESIDRGTLVEQETVRPVLNKNFVEGVGVVATPPELIDQSANQSQHKKT